MIMKKLEHLAQQIPHKASYTPRSGPFSQTTELHWQFRTRVIQPREFSISFLTVGQTFWSLTHNPPGGLGLLSSEGPNEMRDVYCQHVPPAGKAQESQHTAKVWSTMSYGSSRFRITSAWSEPLEDTAWKTPSRMSSASPKSGDVTLIAIISTSDSQYHPQSASLAFHQN